MVEVESGRVGPEVRVRLTDSRLISLPTVLAFTQLQRSSFGLSTLFVKRCQALPQILFHGP